MFSFSQQNVTQKFYAIVDSVYERLDILAATCDKNI
jgi:hypothetical protein